MKIFLDFPKKYNPHPAFGRICAIINLSYIMIANKEVYMKFGYFDDNAKEYVITSPKTPLPWINYLKSPKRNGALSY